MQIDRHIAISAGWVGGPAFGVAMMAAPDYLHLNPIVAAVCFWGGLAVFAATLLTVVLLSSKERESRRMSIGPVVLIGSGLLLFGSGVVWYFYPRGSRKVVASAETATSLDYTIKRTCNLKQNKAADLEGRDAWHFQIYGTPTTGHDPRDYFTQGRVTQGEPLPRQTNTYAPLWKCSFVNLGKEPVTGVSSIMEVTWLETLKTKIGISSGKATTTAGFVTPPLDLGTSPDNREAHFYFWNTSDSFVQAKLAGSVSLKRAGSGTVVQTKLIGADTPSHSLIAWPATRTTDPQGSSHPAPTPPPQPERR